MNLYQAHITYLEPTEAVITIEAEDETTVRDALSQQYEALDNFTIEDISLIMSDIETKTPAIGNNTLH